MPGYPCRCCRSCDCCLNPPAALIVTFDGVAPGTGGDGSLWNQAWELPRDTSFTNSCWYALFDGLPYGFEELRAFFSCEDGGEGGGAVTNCTVFAFKDGLAEVQFGAGGALGTPPINCSIERSINYLSSPFGDTVDWSGATCDVVAG